MNIKRIWKAFYTHYGIDRLIEAIWTIGPLIVTLSTKPTYSKAMRIICCLIGGLLFIYGTHLDIISDKKNDAKLTKIYAMPYSIAIFSGIVLLLTTSYL